MCEVLSPSTEKYDRGTKAPLYAEHGVEWLWLVDPAAKFAEGFHREGGAFRPVRTIRDGESGGLPPFDSVTFVGLFAE